MSLLKRLNTEATTAAPAPAPTKPNSALLNNTASMGTGELFNRPAQATTATLPSNATTAHLAGSLGRQNQATQDAPASKPRLAQKPDSFTEMKARIQNRLVAELDPRMDLTNPDQVRRTVEETYSNVLESEGIVLTRVERM